MSTRGIIGICYENVCKIAYNHSDSYPSGLGVDILTQLHTMLQEKADLIEKFKLLTNVRDTAPTVAQQKKCKPYTDLSVSKQSLDDWYCLLRHTQGNIKNMMDCGCYEDSADFARDSLFCQWGYVINVDNSTLEIFKGFQEAPHDKGRFAALPPAEQNAKDEAPYYPIALVGVISFDRIMADIDSAVKEMNDFENEPEEEAAA